MDTTTTHLPPGIYHIALARHGEVEPALLTRHGQNGVTILPPGAQPDHEQEWRISPGREPGNIIIQLPSLIRPGSYLTYRGAPEKPKAGDGIVYHVSEFAPNEWHPVIAPGFRSLLRVAGSHLGIKLSPATIHPPLLQLGLEHQLEWVFERVRDE